MEGRIKTKSNFDDEGGVSAEDNVVHREEGASAEETVFLDGPSTELEPSCTRQGLSGDIKDPAVFTREKKVVDPSESGPTEQSDCGSSGLTPGQKAWSNAGQEAELQADQDAGQKAVLDLIIRKGSHSDQVEEVNVMDRAGPSNLSCSSGDGVYMAHPQQVSGVQPSTSNAVMERPVLPIPPGNPAWQSNVAVGGSMLLQVGEANRSRSPVSGEELPQGDDSETSSSEDEMSPSNIMQRKRLFRCDTCAKVFTTKRYLENHSRLHTGDKPYQCPYCAQKFTFVNSFVVHKRTHTGQKPYQCDYCKERFTQKSNLAIHRRSHTGEKPFQCEVCGYRFSHASNLKRHKKVKHA